MDERLRKRASTGQKCKYKTMKKIVFFVMVILLCGTVSAQRHTVKRLIREGKAAEGANIEHAETDLSWKGIQVDGVEMISFGDSPDPVRKQMNRAIRDLDDPAYETLISMNQDGVLVWWLVKKEGRKVKEVMILRADDDEPGIWRFKGEMDLDSVLKAVSSNS